MDFKIIIIIFFIFLLIENEIFVVNILGRINNAVDHNNRPTQYGAFIQAVILTITLIILTALTERGFL